MDFRITEEQELMVQAIEEAMTRENLEPYFQDCDKNHTHPEKWWEILREPGSSVRGTGAPGKGSTGSRNDSQPERRDDH